MNPNEGWKDVCGNMIRMNDKIERGRMAITHEEWFDSGPSLYAIEQLQAARTDLDRILKICSVRRADAADDTQATVLYDEPTTDAKDRANLIGFFKQTFVTKEDDRS